MRVKIRFKALTESTIPINYNYYLSSLVYNILSLSDVDFASYLHSEGFSLGEKKFKLFCFSRLFPKNYSVEGENLLIKDYMDWIVTSPIQEFILHLANGLMMQDFVSIGRTKFLVEKTELLNPPNFTTKMSFRSLSPISTSTAIDEGEKRKTVSCSPADSQFAENIKNNLIRKYYLLHGVLPENLSIKFTVNPRYINDRGKLINYKGIMVKGYQVPFTLEADPKIAEVAYHCGVGEKNSGGFGCVEVERG